MDSSVRREKNCSGLYPDLLKSKMKRLVWKEKIINQRLSGEGFKIKVFWYDKLFSTMDVARNLNQGELAEHTLVVSDIQTAGRGRFGRSWNSTGKDLTFSFILKSFNIYFPYSMIAAYSIWQSFREYTDAVKLKWVNDVLWCNGKKIAGALVEEYRDRTVIGIGVNLNRKKFPSTLNDNATSYYLETGIEIPQMDFLFFTLRSLCKNLEFVEKEGREILLSHWEVVSEIKGKNVKIISEGGTFKGKVKGINTKTGALVLKCNEGGELEVYDGSLEILQD